MAESNDTHHRRPLVYDRWRYGPMELLLGELPAQKGAMVLHMLRRELGDSAFWRAMHLFVTRHAHGTVTTDDLRRALQEASGRDLTTFFRQWVYGAGTPDLEVSYRYDTAARQARFTVRQTQATDSITPYFAAAADVQIYTDRGTVRSAVPFEGAVSEHAVAVPAEPRAIEWDPDRTLLGSATLDLSTAMLIYLLRHGSDAARERAATALLSRSRGGPSSGGFIAITIDPDSPTPPVGPPVADQEALDAVLRDARSDSSVRVRASLIQTLMMSAAFDRATQEALLAFSREPHPGIRASAAMAMTGFPGSPAHARLQEMADADPDEEVREAARQKLSMFDFGDAFPVGAPRSSRAPAEPEPATDAERLRALSRLPANRSPAGWALAKRYLTDPRAGREVKESAMRWLGIAVRMSEVEPHASAAELTSLLVPFLASPDPSLRLSAVRELGACKIPAASAALEAHKRVEADVRVLVEIDEALAEIAEPPFGDEPPRRRER
jgi:hypothetical protein